MLTQWPTSESGYRSDAAATAQESLSGTGTAILTGRAALDGDLLGTSVAVTLGESRTTTAEAVTSLLDADIPGPESAQVRAELQPILIGAADGVTTLVAAIDHGDTTTAEATLATLADVQQQLQDFVEGNQ